VGITPPKTLDALADLIAGLRRRIAGKMPPTGQPAALPDTGIKAQLAFIPWKNAFPPAADSSWPDDSPKTLEQFELSPRVLPGNWVKLNRPSLNDDMLIVNYPLRFSRAIDTQVMVSTRHWVRVWADGKLLFARDGGEMIPSFHRVPIHQMAEHHFCPGAHNLLIALMPSPKTKVIEWVAGLAERASRGRGFENWLSHDGFVRAPLEAEAGRKHSDQAVASVQV